MTKKCSICGKKYFWVWRRLKLRGKFNPTTKRKQKVNLQWFSLPSGKKVLACAKCIKKMGKRK